MTSLDDALQITYELRPVNYQPNAITESRQEFTEMEKKIVVLAINQLRHIAKTWQPGQNVTLLIPYSELTTRHHTKIAKAASTLNKKRIGYQDLSKSSEPKFDYITPFPRVRSNKIKGKQYLELLMLADVVPAFIELGKRYTSYKVDMMLSLSSMYAQRMFEIIMMFYGRGQKVFTYEVSRLRTVLNYPADQEYYDFKRKALMTAQREMARKIDFHFEFSASRKSGKSVTEIRFDVKTKQELINDAISQDLLNAQTMQPHEIIAIAHNLIHNYKFTRKQQNLILESPELMETFIRLHTEIYHGKRVVKNPTAYLAQSLGFGKIAPKAVPKTPPSPTQPGKPKQLTVLVAEVMESMKP